MTGMWGQFASSPQAQRICRAGGDPDSPQARKPDADEATRRSRERRNLKAHRIYHQHRRDGWCAQCSLNKHHRCTLRPRPPGPGKRKSSCTCPKSPFNQNQ